MSTSPSPRRLQTAQPRQPDFQKFPYDSISSGARQIPNTLGSTVQSDASEMQAPVAVARAQGREEGEAAARVHFDELLQKERSAVASTLARFSHDRAAYFQKVEAEVVQLSLAIARKILHREAQLDPLLLAGIVRVALEGIDRATKVVLRVHPQNIAGWRAYLATNLASSELPEIVEDSALPANECTLETSMGSAQLGVDVQLKEIERGLMDLLAARPGAKS